MKILHRFYPYYQFLTKFKADNSPVCSFCKTKTESISHLFYECIYSQEFWVEVSLLIYSSCNIVTPITEDKVLPLNCITKICFINNIIKLLYLLENTISKKLEYLQHRQTSVSFVLNYNTYLTLSVQNYFKQKSYLTSHIYKKLLHKIKNK